MTVSSVRRSIHGPIPAKVNQEAHHKGYRYGNLRRGIDVWRQGTRPKKKSHPKVHRRKKCKVTSHADSGGLAPVNGYLRRGKSQHWAAVDAVTAGLTGVSQRQSDRRRKHSHHQVLVHSKQISHSTCRRTEKSRDAPINTRTWGGGRRSHSRSHQRITTTDSE
jgi:hypothetical protein